MVVPSALLRLFLLRFCGCFFCVSVVVSSVFSAVVPSALLWLLLLRFGGCLYCSFAVVSSVVSRSFLLCVCGCSFCVFVVISSALLRLSLFGTSAVVSLFHFCGYSLCDSTVVSSVFLWVFLLRFWGCFFCDFEGVLSEHKVLDLGI